MQQELWGRQPAPFAFLLPGWCLDSCFPPPVGGWSFAPRQELGCHSTAGAAVMKTSCPSLCKPNNGTFLQGSTGGCCSPPALCPFPPCPPHMWCGSCDNLCSKSSRLRCWVQGQVQQGPYFKKMSLPWSLAWYLPKGLLARWVFREDLNKEREEAWQLHLGLHQPLTICVQTWCSSVALSLLSCWWLWFLLCLFIFTPLLYLLFLNSLFLLAPDKLLFLISLKLLPLNNL